MRVKNARLCLYDCVCNFLIEFFYLSGTTYLSAYEY